MGRGEGGTWPSARQHEDNVTLCFPLTEESALICPWITHFLINFKLPADFALLPEQAFSSQA